MIELPNKFKIGDTEYDINKLSVLQNFKKENFSNLPFPNIIIENCLPEEIYSYLEDNYPSDDLIFNLDKNNHEEMYHNTRYQISSAKALNSEAEKQIDPIWLLFIKYHSSELFFKEIILVFGESFTNFDIIRNEISSNDIMFKLFGKKRKNLLKQIKNNVRKINSNTVKINEINDINNNEEIDILKNDNDLLIENNQKLQDDLNNLVFDINKAYSIDNLSIGIRKLNNSNISLDCQIGINSPCKTKSIVKGPHIDNLSEIYAGLFYMKQKEDIGEGGDLLIYETKTKYKSRNDFIEDNPFIKINKVIDNKPFIEHRGFDIDKLNLVKTIKYDRNKLVIFLSTIDSIHAVSEREANPISRRLVNIISEFCSGYTRNRYMV